MTNNKGYTFLELMIALSIFSILILVIYGTFFTEIKKHDDRTSKINMNIEANRAMETITDVINEEADISVANQKTINGSGTILIDTLDDGNNYGTLLNVYDKQLIDDDGRVLCDEVESITFIMGPDNTTDIGVVAGVILIQITLEKGNVSYFLKGGVNIER